MTKLLEEAFCQGRTASLHEQEALAAWIMEELAAEAKWDQAFGASGDGLGQLADEAIREHQAGRTKPLHSF